MDYLLRFKSHFYSQTFSSDLSIRLKTRFYLGLAVNACFLILLINDLLYHAPLSKTLIDEFEYPRLALLILWIIIMGYFCRRTQKLKRYATVIQVILDIIMVFIASTDFFWILASHASETPTDIRGDEVIGWSTGVLFSCSLFLINSWQTRIIACIFKFIIFTLVTLISIELSEWKIGILGAILLLQSYTVYNRERYDRRQHIERMKVFQDSQAVLKILDDITEGILIIDECTRIRYMNMPVKKIFRSDTPSLNDLFSKITVKSVSSSQDRCKIPCSVNCISNERDLMLFNREIRWICTMKKFHHICFG